MKLRFRPYTLELKHVFTIATSSRTTTPAMLTEIEYDGVVGYGEASMPPYLGESQEGRQGLGFGGPRQGITGIQLDAPLRLGEGFQIVARIEIRPGVIGRLGRQQLQRQRGKHQCALHILR